MTATIRFSTCLGIMIILRLLVRRSPEICSCFFHYPEIPKLLSWTSAKGCVRNPEFCGCSGKMTGREFFGLVGWNKTEKYHEQPRLAVVVHQLQAHPFMPASADSWAVNFDPRIFLRPSTLQCEQKRPGLPADQQRTVRFRVSGYDWGGAG